MATKSWRHLPYCFKGVWPVITVEFGKWNVTELNSYVLPCGLYEMSIFKQVNDILTEKEALLNSLRGELTCYLYMLLWWPYMMCECILLSALDILFVLTSLSFISLFYGVTISLAISGRHSGFKITIAVFLVLTRTPRRM